MKEVDLGGEKSFIGAWYIPDLKVCDELIAYFKSSPGKESGQIGHDRQVNKAIKDSLDLIIEPPEFSHPTLRKYVINLMEVTKNYMENTRPRGSSMRGASPRTSTSNITSRAPATSNGTPRESARCSPRRTAIWCS